MSSAKQTIPALLSLFFALSGCEQEQAKATAPPAKTTAPQPTAAPTPPPTASAPESKPRDDCPEGSKGEGTFQKPCEASGTSRMMEVTWTKKMDDKGPSFRVVNKSKNVILYGRMLVYFYDKAGKPLEVTDTHATPPKKKPYQVCFGNIFEGVMKPAEKAVITFSCVKKENVPEGATAIEAEMQMVGFPDASEKKVDFYWRNNDIGPDTRPKGGLKK